MDARASLHQILTGIAGKRKEISDNTRIYHDLSISGDDAIEMMENIRQRFGVCFDGFRFDLYFPGEAEAIYWHIAKMFGGGKGKRDLTFGHLLAVVERGHWFDP